MATKKKFKNDKVSLAKRGIVKMSFVGKKNAKARGKGKVRKGGKGGVSKGG